MPYKSDAACIAYDGEDGICHGRVAGTPMYLEGEHFELPGCWLP
jgi:hypothetical protein